jgi:hypothetical protein
MTYKWHPSNPGMLYELEDHAHSDRPRLSSRRVQGRQVGKPERLARRTKFASLAGVCRHYQARAPSAAKPRPRKSGDGLTAFQNFGLENLAWQADCMIQDDVLIGLPCTGPLLKPMPSRWWRKARPVLATARRTLRGRQFDCGQASDDRWPSSPERAKFVRGEPCPSDDPLLIVVDALSRLGSSAESADIPSRRIRAILGEPIARQDEDDMGPGKAAR